MLPAPIQFCHKPVKYSGSKEELDGLVTLAQTVLNIKYKIFLLKTNKNDS